MGLYKKWSTQSELDRIKWVALILFVITLGVTATSLSNPFVLDDLSKIVGNPDIRILSDLPQKLIYPYETTQILERNDPSRPLVFIIYALIYHFFKTSPIPYHLVSVLLHFSGGVLIYLITRHLIKSWKLKMEEAFAVVPALFFILTPINLGTVIYAYGLSDVLSSCLMLAALYAYFRPEAPIRLPYPIPIACLLMILALASKQSAVVFPALLVAYDFIDMRQQPPGGLKSSLLARAKNWAPFFAVSIGYILLRQAYFGALGDLEGRGNTHSLGDYLGVQPLMILNYVWLSFIPKGLTVDHYIFPGLYSSLQKAVGLAAFVCLNGLIFWPWPKAKSSGLWHLVQFGWLIFLIVLLPVSLGPTVDCFVERRVYLGAFGLGLVCMSFVRVAFQYWYLFLLQALVYGAVGIHRNWVFSDPKRVWIESLETYPLSIRARSNLASAFIETKQYDPARGLLEGLAIDVPKDPYVLVNLAGLYSNDLYPNKDLQRAEALLKKALEVKPDLFLAHYSLARLYQVSGRLEDAQEHYRRTLEIFPNHVLAHNNLGVLYQRTGQKEKARLEFEAALRIDPGNLLASGNLRGLSQEVHLIPLDQVSSEVIIRAYQEGLRKEPNNKKIQDEYLKFCRSRKIKCP